MALAALLAGPITVNACSCPNTDDTVLGKFEAARFVVVARVVSVEWFIRANSGILIQDDYIAAKKNVRAAVNAALQCSE